MPTITMSADVISAAHRHRSGHEKPDSPTGRSNSTLFEICVATTAPVTHITAAEKATSHNPHPADTPMGAPNKLLFGIVMIRTMLMTASVKHVTPATAIPQATGTAHRESIEVRSHNITVTRARPDKPPMINVAVPQLAKSSPLTVNIKTLSHGVKLPMTTPTLAAIAANKDGR
jgi:hypothetical protein